MAEPSVMLTHSSRAWAQRLHFHLIDHGGGLLSGYALAAEDVLRASPDVLFVDDICSFVTRRLIEDLLRRSVTVVGVYEPGETGAGRARLDELGIERQVAADAPAEAFLTIMGPPTAADVPLRSGVRPGAEARRRGTIVAVAAATGGAGATEVSAALAWSGSRRTPVVLADVDEKTPSVAVRLGLSPHPGIIDAVSAARNGDSLEHFLHSGGRRHLAVLAGSAHRLDRRVRAAGATSVLRRLAIDGHVVANCGADVEEPVLTGSFAGSEVTRAVLAEADVVVLVAVAGPVGIVRLADWLDHAGHLIEPSRLHIVMNRFPRRGFRSDEMLRELRSLLDASTVRVLPHDSRVDRASWRGRHVGRGPFARRVRRMARELMPSRLPTR